MASNIKEPKRASFLGLATETRLQIYSHLLIPYTTPEDLKALKEQNHCCAFPRRSRRDDTIDIACDCKNKNLHPQILYTNKQIFNEAVHILYENMELRVRLPYPISFRDSPLQNLIAALPAYAHRHVSKIAIIGTTAEASEKHRDPRGQTWSYPLGQYAALITSAFPNMRSVRLHVDFGSGGSGRRTAVESFGLVVPIPGLEVVEVEVDGGGMPVWEGSWASCMRAQIGESVRRAAEVWGREIEVREVVEEGEGKGIEGLRCFERGTP
jgi:hypothetical protein